MNRDQKSDLTKRSGRLAVELSHVANHLHREGIGDGAAAVDDANAEVTRLRLEVERLAGAIAERDALQTAIAEALALMNEGGSEAAWHVLVHAASAERGQ